MRIRLLTYFFLFNCILSFGQSSLQEKRIYLVDVTASMSGKGSVKTPDIFDKVKNELVNTLIAINNPNTEIVIIPFTNKPHNKIEGYIKEKETLIQAINNLSIKNGDTNIADAWSLGMSEIDPNRINYIFMLTDGLHNTGPNKEILNNRLRNWADFSNGQYYFAFYVMLTPNAKEQDICNIVEETNQMWLIESMNVNTTFLNSSLNLMININNNKTVKLQFTTNNPDELKKIANVSLSLENNSFYNISNVKSFIHNGGYILFDINELKPHSETPLEIKLALRILYDKTKYPLVFFTPENLNFNIVNRGIREMTIKEKKL